MENSPCLDQNARRDGVGALPDRIFPGCSNKSIAEERVPGLFEIILWPGVSRLVAGLEHLNRLTGHDRRYGVLINELGMPVAAQQYAEIVEPCDDTLQFDAIDQEDRERNLVLTDKIEKSVLQILWPLRSHVPVSLFCFWRRGQRSCSLKTTGASLASLPHGSLRLRDLLQRLQYEAAGMPCDTVSLQVGNKFAKNTVSLKNDD